MIAGASGLLHRICPDFMIDKWETVETEKVKTGESSIKDVYVGKHLISEKTRERYLGDVIDSKRKMNSNIEKRVQKGHEKLWAIVMTFASENITLLSQKCSEIHCCHTRVQLGNFNPT